MSDLEPATPTLVPSADDLTLEAYLTTSQLPDTTPWEIPDLPPLAEAVELVKAGHNVLERFWETVDDVGIGVQIREQIALRLLNTPQGAEQILELFEHAMGDLTVPAHLNSHDPFNLIVMVRAAASLEFLGRYAVLVNPRVLPRRNIPSPLLVAACLALFHDTDSDEFQALEDWYEDPQDPVR